MGKQKMIISVSGVSGIGKTTLCKRLKQFANQYKISSESVELDSYILDREERNRLGLAHGYVNQAYNIDKAISDLDDIIFNHKEIKTYLYNHKNGKYSTEYVVKKPSEIIIIDGSTSLQDQIFKRYNPKGIFMDINNNLILRFKMFTDLKRGYPKEDLIKDAQIYYKWFINECRPQKKNAEIIITLQEYTPKRIYTIIRGQNGI